MNHQEDFDLFCAALRIAYGLTPVAFHADTTDQYVAICIPSTEYWWIVFAHI